MPGGVSRRSMAHFGLSQRLPFRYSLMPSRRQIWQTESRWRAIGWSVVSCQLSVNVQCNGQLTTDGGLNASFLRRPAAVVGQRRDVFDGLDGQAGALQGGDGGFASRARTLDAHFDFLQAELGGLVRGRLRRTLRGERRAFAAALE